MTSEHFFTPYTKTNSKWNNYLNVGHESIEFLEESVGRALYSINCSTGFCCLFVLFCFFFLYLSPKTKKNQSEINKQDLIKLKSYFTGNDTMENKKTTNEWEKIFATI